MRILFWMFIGFDQHTTSEHLLSAVIERLCEAGHSVHVIQKNTGGSLPAIPKKLREYGVTTDVIPFQAADKGNFVARYLAELKYINPSSKRIHHYIVRCPEQLPVGEQKRPFSGRFCMPAA